MKNRNIEFAVRVKRTRKRYHENQSKFAKRLGVSQATASAWETGKDRPSPVHRMILALLASQQDKKWFVGQARAKMKPAIEADGMIQREWAKPPKKGEIVRIPCEVVTGGGIEGSDRLLPLPPELISSPASTTCLIIDEIASNKMLMAHDIIVLDTSDNASPNLLPFVNQLVLLEIDRSARRHVDPEFTWGKWPDRLCMGLLRCKRWKADPVPEEYLRRIPIGTRLSPPIPFWLATVGPFDDFETTWDPSCPGTYIGYWDAIGSASYNSFEEVIAWIAETERQAPAKIRLEDACRILGRVVAWFRPPRKNE